jgi:hypothetical protein
MKGGSEDMLTKVKGFLGRYSIPAIALAIVGFFGGAPVAAFATDPTDPDYAGAIGVVWTKVAAGLTSILPAAMGLFGVLLAVGLVWKFGRRAAKA